MALLNTLFGPNIRRLARRKDVEGLITALSYPRRWKIRRDAAIALGKLADTRAVVPLIAALKDAKDDVRQAARSALASGLCPHPSRRETVGTYCISVGTDFISVGTDFIFEHCAVCGCQLNVRDNPNRVIRAKGAIGHDELNVNTMSRSQWKAHTRAVSEQGRYTGNANTPNLGGANARSSG